MGDMDESPQSRLEAMRPAIKHRWSTLLRLAPAASALGHPDTLVFSMDQTLGQLVAALRDAGLPDSPRRRGRILTPVQAHCGCGLNPLLSYFITGEQALIETAAPELGGDLNDILLLYHGLAQREIEALCGVCVHRNSEACASARAHHAAGTALG